MFYTLCALVAALGTLAIRLVRADRGADWEARYLRAGVDPMLLQPIGEGSAPAPQVP